LKKRNLRVLGKRCRLGWPSSYTFQRTSKLTRERGGLKKGVGLDEYQTNGPKINLQYKIGGGGGSESWQVFGVCGGDGGIVVWGGTKFKGE